jgi:hypothetical protein
MEAEVEAELERVRAELATLKAAGRPQPEVIDLKPEDVTPTESAEPTPEPANEADNGQAEEDAAREIAGIAPAAKTDLDLYKERVTKITESLASAYQAGRFMVAVYSLQDGKITLTRHTHDFPADDFPTAVKLLRQNLEGTGGPPAVQPLPRAAVNRLTAEQRLFGAKAEEPVADGQEEKEEEEDDE